MKVGVKLLNDNARIPKFAHSDDACADLYATEQVIIQPGEFCLVGTGIAIELEVGWEVQIRPRSGMATKHGITIVNTPGTIDAGYRGEIKVILTNLAIDPFEVDIGDRIAQIAVRPVPKVEFVEKEILTETVRATGGFGST